MALREPWIGMSAFQWTIEAMRHLTARMERGSVSAWSFPISSRQTAVSLMQGNIQYQPGVDQKDDLPSGSQQESGQIRCLLTACSLAYTIGYIKDNKI